MWAVNVSTKKNAFNKKNYLIRRAFLVHTVLELVYKLNEKVFEKMSRLLKCHSILGGASHTCLHIYTTPIIQPLLMHARAG